MVEFDEPCAKLRQVFGGKLRHLSFELLELVHRINANDLLAQAAEVFPYFVPGPEVGCCPEWPGPVSEVAAGALAHTVAHNPLRACLAASWNC